MAKATSAKEPKQTSSKKVAKRRGDSTYASYLHKVLKQVHPELSIKKNAIMAVDGIMKDCFDRVIYDASTVARGAKKSTLSSKHVQSAVRSLMPGELATHAISEGTKAVGRFTS